MAREFILQNADLVLYLFLVAVSAITGMIGQRRHYESIYRREDALERLPATNTKEIPFADAQVHELRLVHGEVVITTELIRFLIGWINGLVGGPIRAFETTLDRARREAVLRMKESVPEAAAIVNTRMEYVPMSFGLGSRTSCVEVVVYGTAVILKQERDNAQPQAA